MRDHNEDAVLSRPDLDLWVVADGMGGHAAGDVASQLIIEKLNALQPADALPRMCDETEQALQAANLELRERSRGSGNRIMGSTVVFLIIKQGYVLCGWAGDSRAYCLRDGQLLQVSRDHSHVEELVQRGELTPEQALDHPQANVVTRAVGGEPRLMIDYVVREARPGDRYLLCSDGLNKEMEDEQIAQVLGAAEDIEQGADRLIALALEHGGHDNTSVVLVELLPDDEAGEAGDDTETAVPAAAQQPEPPPQ